MAESKMTVSDVLQKADIALDSYDDIFSDFDFSPYEKRLLSEDFLRELNRRYSYTSKGQFVINFTLPKANRSQKTETIIKKRLKDHFRRRLKQLDKRMKEKTKQGLIQLFFGIILSGALVFIPELDSAPALTIFSVLIWYLIWSGFDRLLEPARGLRRKKNFADKFLRAEYNFTSEEEVVESLGKVQAQKPEATAQKSPKSS